jgi:hypothetical protein
VRYHALLLLQSRLAEKGDVYPYIGIFIGKLKSDNSYQRNIGALLTAASAQWDNDDQIDAAMSDYLALLDDDKPITVRQCLQQLGNIIHYKPALRGVITQSLLAFDITKVRETMRKSILLDILGALAEIRKYGHSNGIEEYIQKALAEGILDRKAVKDVESMMKLK